jgi:hypothetical protein
MIHWVGLVRAERVGLTPFEFIYKPWTEQPQRLRLDPTHHMPGLNTKTGTRFRGKSMHRITATALVALGVCLLAGCASKPPPVTTNLGSTEGTISFSGGAFALGIGFQWGNGTLIYQGGQYPFSLRGLSVLDVGVSSITGSGRVHNLSKLTDFNGNYVAATAGVTVAGGGSVTSLRNQNGVVIDGITTAQGVRLTLAPGGVNITLTGQPSS